MENVKQFCRTTTERSPKCPAWVINNPELRLSIQLPTVPEPQRFFSVNKIKVCFGELVPFSWDSAQNNISIVFSGLELCGVWRNDLIFLCQSQDPLPQVQSRGMSWRLTPPVDSCRCDVSQFDYAVLKHLIYYICCLYGEIWGEVYGVQLSIRMWSCLLFYSRDVSFSQTAVVLLLSTLQPHIEAHPMWCHPGEWNAPKETLQAQSYWSGFIQRPPWWKEVSSRKLC